MHSSSEPILSIPPSRAPTPTTLPTLPTTSSITAAIDLADDADLFTGTEFRESDLSLYVDSSAAIVSAELLEAAGSV